MHSARIYHTLTMLADGTVLAVGGENSSDQSIVTSGVLHGRDLGPGDGDVDQRGRRWRRPATTTRPRCSCPTAACSWPAAATTTAAAGPGQFSAQFYSPPYLFNGSRPTIANAPAGATYGSNFTVSTPDAASIRSVNLVSLGADTHQSDMDQHFVPLSFTAGSGSLTVQAPAAAALAPPGTYMLFIVDDKGVPSVASMVGMSRTPRRAGDAGQADGHRGRRPGHGDAGRLPTTAAARSRSTR